MRKKPWVWLLEGTSFKGHLSLLRAPTNAIFFPSSFCIQHDLHFSELLTRRPRTSTETEMGEAWGCAVHPAGDRSRDQCGDVTNSDGQILGIESRKQAAASGQASPLSHVFHPVYQSSAFAPHTWPVDPFWAAGARGMMKHETSSEWELLLPESPLLKVSLKFMLRSWSVGVMAGRLEGALWGTGWPRVKAASVGPIEDGCHGLTWDSGVSSKSWPCPSLQWEGPGRCADLPSAVTSLESPRASVFLLCFVRAQWCWELSLGRCVGKEFLLKSGVGAGKWEGGNCRTNYFLIYWWHVQSVNSSPLQTVLFCCHPKPSQGHWKQVILISTSQNY